MLEDFLLFSLDSFSCIAKHIMTLQQLWFWSCSDSLDTNFEYLVLIMISHHHNQYHRCQNPPVTLEWVLYTVPDIECTVNTVGPPSLIFIDITVERPTIISQFATCVAAILRNWICLHPSNGCRYCHAPCSVTCWVYLSPNHLWIHNCNDCVGELSWPIGFDID